MSFGMNFENQNPPFLANEKSALSHTIASNTQPKNTVTTFPPKIKLHHERVWKDSLVYNKIVKSNKINIYEE